MIVHKLGRLVSTMFCEISLKEHFVQEHLDLTKGYTFYLVCQDLLANPSLPNNPKSLKVDNKP